MSTDISQQLQFLESKIRNLRPEEFEDIAMEVFRFQFENNMIYKEFAESLSKTPAHVSTLDELPFLPISAFKSHPIKIQESHPEIVFESSGTGGITSQHHVSSIKWYQEQSKRIFEAEYGPLSEYCILALLPSYLERGNSSLVFMVDHFMKESHHPDNGFYLKDYSLLKKTLEELYEKSQKTLLIGVSFALLDFAEKFELQKNPQLIVMETGGMKGRRKELIREELHHLLGHAFHKTDIHSEYGMTELLSQAYSKGKGIFEENRFLSVRIGKQNQPFDLCKEGEIGKIKLIDLSNLYSCSFIATDDLGRKCGAGQFEVLGRSDIAELRGCNLMLI